MQSGIRVDEDAVKKYTEMKIKKTYTFLILAIKGDVVVVESAGTGGVDDVSSALPKDNCAFVVFDKGRDITLFMYASPDAKTNARTIYSTTKQTVEKALEGVKLYKNLVEDYDEIKDALA